ncbi:hypothetical protein [Novosphingobium clariflavum]|uniref:Uncharacterized protein n=1 Tax=Novosphingobium clariflavum TaxID=2029884 RepID=A0ABV6S1Z4_9SPHN|nr:hypothetical protein [Novosphingobium clariflavum]
MGALITLLVRLGVGESRAKYLAPVSIVLAVLVACAALWGVFQLWDAADDRRAIEAAQAKAGAEFQARQIAAERNASAAKAHRDREEAARQNKMEVRVDEASKHGGSAADDVWNSGLWD